VTTPPLELPILPPVSATTFELPIVQQAAATRSEPPRHSEAWLRAARQAKLLAWASLGWMTVEGCVGVLAGVQAHSLGVVTWATSSFVEALASLIVVWRFTGSRALSPTSEARAQRWVAASFFLLAPFFAIEAIRKLVNGGATHATILAIALTLSAIILMPLLGRTKLRLGKTLDSGATTGEGIQNIMCAVQAATALLGVAAAGIGLSFLDPIAALLIAAIALKEGRDGWHGQNTCCTPIPRQDGATGKPTTTCHDDCGI
jgi:divalent metal cation (Fe/Co/Zn/Cd) transporter